MTEKCPKCGKRGLGLIINADGKKVLMEFNMFGETAHSLTCPKQHEDLCEILSNLNDTLRDILVKQKEKNKRRE